MKAYDTVDWGFLIEVLTTLNTPIHVINWIKACICSPKFSVSVNGGLEGYFQGKRGLRQGDPLSPYLFVIVMEVLSRLLSNATAHPSFKFHARCQKLKLTHLCFADDLQLFNYGNADSTSIIKKVLNDFAGLSGLKANLNKSVIFFSGISNGVKESILHNMGFS